MGDEVGWMIEWREERGSARTGWLVACRPCPVGPNGGIGTAVYLC